MVNYLKQEKATSKNIKSDQVRHEVERNLDRIIQRLKYYNEGGVVLFSGNDSLYEMMVEGIPWYYRCSKTFQTNLIGDSLDDGEIIGCIAMDLTHCGFALICGTRMEVLREITSGIPNKHRAGGYSSQRFKHLREEAKRNWFKRIADHVREYFMDGKRVKRFIIHGESFTKREFLKAGVLEYRLQKIAELSDGCYAGEDGLYELKNRLG